MEGKYGEGPWNNSNINITKIIGSEKKEPVFCWYGTKMIVRSVYLNCWKTDFVKTHGFFAFWHNIKKE